MSSESTQDGVSWLDNGAFLYVMPWRFDSWCASGGQIAAKRRVGACFAVTIKSRRVLCDDNLHGVQSATLKDVFDNVGMGAGRWRARFSSPS